MMPGINGFELCKKIRNSAETPFLMISWLNMIEDRVAGFICGADDYLIKTFSIKELISRIDSVKILQFKTN
jgi:DNA-binding response OmpR family regulator